MPRQSVAAVPAALPLVRAAVQAGVGYLVLRDAVMRGLVIGWQDEKRHWFIDPASLAAYIARQRRSERAAPQPTTPEKRRQ